LNVDDDVGFFQFLLQTLILASQLFVFSGQRITLRARTSLLRKRFVNCGVAFLAPPVQRRGINSFAPQHGADAAVPGSALDVLQNPLLVFRAELAPLRLGRHLRIRRTGYERNCQLGFAHDDSPGRPAL
jgi:hypothetical protein